MSISGALPLNWKLLLNEGRERNLQTVKPVYFPLLVQNTDTLYWEIMKKYEIEATAKCRYRYRYRYYEALYVKLKLP